MPVAGFISLEARYCSSLIATPTPSVRAPSPKAPFSLRLELHRQDDPGEQTRSCRGDEAFSLCAKAAPRYIQYELAGCVGGKMTTYVLTTGDDTYAGSAAIDQFGPDQPEPGSNVSRKMRPAEVRVSDIYKSR